MFLKPVKNISQTFLLCLATCVPALCMASDITREVHQHGSSGDGNGGYFELGMGLEYREGISLINEENSPLMAELRLNAGYQWNNFFVDLYPSSVTPFLLGYNLVDKQNYSVDVVTGPQNGGFTQEDIGNAAAIKERNFDYLAGLRLTRYYGDTIVQVEARGDISNIHNGSFFLAVAGHSWALANGSQYVLGGAAYQTKNVLDYYFGITPEEANDQIAAYSADAAFFYRFEYGITYPLSAKWIVRTSSTLYKFDSSVLNSPLTDNSHSTLIEADVSINYVF